MLGFLHASFFFDIWMRCDEGKELLWATLAEARAQRRCFIVAFVIMLVSFLLRASFDLLQAYASVCAFVLFVR